MGERDLEPDVRQALDKVLGYLNFSAGAADPAFLGYLNLIFEFTAQQSGTEPLWQQVGLLLTEGLETLKKTSPAFQDSEQATAILPLVFEHTPSAYQAFHRDLLFNCSAETLFRPFFMGRMCEAVLRQGGPWDETERITAGAIRLLNDFVGYRPVPSLESRRIEPYPHEFVRPIPLYVRGAGVTFGREREVIKVALKLLEETDEDILRRASFDIHKLDELAVDPRAYDFDHPANKRPNYHFGQWDPNLISNQGHYRRFVVQQVTLDALLHRLTNAPDLPHDEVVFEAAAVLAGTILMASGISGEGPGTFDSNTSLSKLLPIVAKYRDEFYERLIDRAAGKHAIRLRKEAEEKRQPFGGARQHLNAQLARQRAAQLEHVHLAAIFATLGFWDAARRQVNIVPCASARMRSEIECLLATGQILCDERKLEEGARIGTEMVDVLRRGIECGAFVDPWNILGFDAHFSLFPSMENSVHDHRVDDLLDVLDGIFAWYAQLWSEAAASDRQDLAKKISRQFRELATWWHKFAAHEVSSVDASDSLAVRRAAERVADALNVWHKGGAAAGDVAFWAPHAEMFDSPKAYVLVIDALLKHGDYVASLGLLVHWLSQAETIPLEQADCSFHELAVRWMVEVTTRDDNGEAGRSWELARKFIDYLEANADSYWHVPQFKLGNSTASGNSQPSDEFDDEPEDVDMLEAAYENMVYRDSTDDGVQGPIFETDDTTHDELVAETKRVAERISFLQTLAELWRQAAIASSPGRTQATAGDEKLRQSRLASLGRWTEQAAHNQRALNDLLVQVREFPIPVPTGEHDSLVEYDRRRLTKESLLDRIVGATVETAEAALLLASSASAMAEGVVKIAEDEEAGLVAAVCGALFRNDLKRFRKTWPKLLEALGRRPLLYVPLTKGGDPRQIVTVRIRQRSIQNLLSWLPRRGLWVETCELLEVAREMERSHPVGPGAVTEFDELFKVGYKAIVESLVASADAWPETERDKDEGALVAFLEQLTESLLASWLAHSRTLRLSVLEKVHDSTQWKKLVAFVERYGDELFTQRFLNLANIRAILYQGVETWLAAHDEEEFEEAPETLQAAVQNGEISREEVSEHLTLVLEAIVENYGEYRDYNSTTTQSDRGEMLYTLLDFLRLRTRYDRVCWNLKPVVLAHEILVRRRHSDAARMWHRALDERISDEAHTYLKKLAELQRKYAMRMPTVADRLAEKFTRPLAIDRVRALVIPAMAEGKKGGPAPQFEVLEEEVETFTREPTGVGLDVPMWLQALEEEVELATRPVHERQRDELIASVVPQVKLKAREVHRQLDRWTERQKRLP